MSDRKPTNVVCLCGSTRFPEAFIEANRRETLAGSIVLSIGCDMRQDNSVFGATEAERRRTKAKLDVLHFRKIDLSDEVLVLNVGGYIGESTEREIEYAQSTGKRVRFLEYREAVYGIEAK